MTERCINLGVFKAVQCRAHIICVRELCALSGAH